MSARDFSGRPCRATPALTSEDGHAGTGTPAHRRRSRAGFSLMEILVVTAILSASLMVVFYQLRATARTSSFNRQHLIAWQLLANMFERYRLMPNIKLSEMFLGGGGQRFIESDPILNSDQVMTSDEVQRLGFTRDAYYHYPPARSGAGILHLVVTWKGIDGKPHSVSQDVVQGGQPQLLPPMVLADRAPDRTESAPSGPAPDAAPMHGATVGQGEHALIRRLRQIDRKDGHEDIDWPQVSPDASLTSAIDAAVRALKRQTIPDGTYPLEWEEFSVDVSEGPGPLGERGKLTVLELACPSGSLYLMLREEYRPASGGDALVRILNGEPIASRGEHSVDRVVSPSQSLAAPIGSVAHVDLSPSRLLIYRQQADVDGREVPLHQTLELVTLDAALSRALVARHASTASRDTSASLEALLTTHGLSLAPLPPDRDSRQRLGW